MQVPIYRCLLDIANGMVYLHSMGVVHGMPLSSVQDSMEPSQPRPPALLIMRSLHGLRPFEPLNDRWGADIVPVHGLSIPSSVGGMTHEDSCLVLNVYWHQCAHAAHSITSMTV